ncbi:phenylacetate-CoA oxygenase/reductase subunit PaaK [Paraneptunicella aestuarii]|uniref:1,2-phenylacetyl-CoA epoxidase subunit PaaE n=1 Tax=Paraneptunicella aestuarii TaxID=2831148 RepID=UPI001E469D98|nr:1,2-phenylacetyl-CoA epoxidase subunit PaaE [Paraneptunicella aestuarii]UAA37441.1 phenylacetate-CoA oxygenase/reductase subunit PaaK [Paraneptunicella aestuarii]
MSDTQFYPLTIQKVEPETDSAICVSFQIPDQHKDTFRFIQGQFLTLKATINGEEIRRAYSICSGVNDDTLRVAIKRVNGGKFSNYANDTFKAGDVVEVMPPQGEFNTELSADNEKRYMCIAVGSGITPILSIVKSILDVEPNSEVTLIYGNQQTSSIMFREELNFLKNQYLTRFQWINVMSQEDQGSDLLYGRINNKRGYLLQKHKLIDIKNMDDVFICGPESMMSEVSRGFRIEGLREDQIHYELFSSSSEDAQQALAKAKERVKNYGEDKTSKITLTSDGRTISFELATVGENILDAGIDNGMVLPYSCKGGVCSTCKAKLVKGKVDMDITHGLEQHEIDDGYILTCQAHPVSDEVVVDFDQR